MGIIHIVSIIFSFNIFILFLSLTDDGIGFGSNNVSAHVVPPTPLPPHVPVQAHAPATHVPAPVAKPIQAPVSIAPAGPQQPASSTPASGPAGPPTQTSWAAAAGKGLPATTNEPPPTSTASASNGSTSKHLEQLNSVREVKLFTNSL